MDEYKNHDESGIDRTFAALADPTRRAIFVQLASGDFRVTELANPFQMSLNSVSKHIKKLEGAGLIRRRRVGREHYLSADQRKFDEAAHWFEDHRHFWNSRLDRLEELLLQAQKDENGD